MGDDLSERLHEVERISWENAVAIERAAADARHARDAAAEFRPIVLERSGDAQRRDKFETNVNQAHDKIREHSRRLSTLERWKDRAHWTGILVMFLGGVLAWIIDKVIALQK